MNKKELEKRFDDLMQCVVDYCTTFNEVEYSINCENDILVIGKFYDDNEKLIKYGAFIDEVEYVKSLQFYQVNYLLSDDDVDDLEDDDDDWSPREHGFLEFHTYYKRPIVDNHICADSEEL